jgi:hypothetical protein
VRVSTYLPTLLLRVSTYLELNYYTTSLNYLPTLLLRVSTYLPTLLLRVSTYLELNYYTTSLNYLPTLLLRVSTYLPALLRVSTPLQLFVNSAYLPTLLLRVSTYSPALFEPRTGPIARTNAVVYVSDGKKNALRSEQVLFYCLRRRTFCMLFDPLTSRCVFCHTEY